MSFDSLKNSVLDFGPPAFDSIREDLGTLARESRRLLNDAGLPRLKIFASSSLDEHQVEKLVRSQAPIDGFGVGTQMAVSGDAASIDAVYKLVEYAGIPRIKRSPGKHTLPGRKQVFRQIQDGVAVRDVIGRPDEQIASTAPLKPRMIGGKRGQCPTAALSNPRVLQATDAIAPGAASPACSGPAILIR